MIAHFCLWLICGMSLMWCLMPRAQVSSGFFRIQMLVALGLSVLAALTMGKFEGNAQENVAPLLPPNLGAHLCLMLAVGALAGSQVWALERRREGEWIALIIALLSSAALLFSFPRLNPFSQPAELLRLLSNLSSALLLGSAMTAMLLGHWYLTAPTMSIEPLKRLTGYFAAAGGLRLLTSAAALFLAWEALTDNGTFTYWTWLSLRWIAGVIGPLVIALMAWRILKYRNTQAATGVLFVGVILTFIGELTGALLYRSLSVPL